MQNIQSIFQQSTLKIIWKISVLRIFNSVVALRLEAGDSKTSRFQPIFISKKKNVGTFNLSNI